MITDAMMSDPELHERLAKRWCELMGLNPYEFVAHWSEVDPVTGYQPGILQRSPRWTLVARDVRSNLAWLKAILELA